MLCLIPVRNEQNIKQKQGPQAPQKLTSRKSLKIQPTLPKWRIFAMKLAEMAFL